YCGKKKSHTRITRATDNDAAIDTSLTKIQRTNQKLNNIVSWIIGFLVIVILALSIWLTNFYRQEVNNILLNMKSLIEPSQSTADTNWMQFDDPHGRFSAYLPGTPEVRKYTFEIQGETMPGYT